jgi:hypothetical protein
VIFASTGATTSAGVGDSSNLGGLYSFKDSAAGVNWWQAAATAGPDALVPAGDYRTTAAGPQGTVNNSPETNMTAAFAGVANPNGTWTLTVSDNAGLDTGAVSAATLRLTTGGGGGCPTPTPTPSLTPTPSPTPSVSPTPAGPSIQFSSSTYIDDESQTAVITITRTGDTTGTNSVTFATSNGTATGGASCAAGVDYVSVNQTVTFNPGETSKTVNVPLCGDQLTEIPNQTVNLALTGANLGTPNTAVLTINDTASQYQNTGPISVNNAPGPAPEAVNPYPSNITVANAPVTIGSMRVTLYDFSHTEPDSVDVLLVGPGGQEFILMADAGGNAAIPANNTVTLSFRDAGPGVLPDNGPLTTGNFEPTSWTTPVANFPAPAPAGPYNEPGSTVGGTGTQTLFGNFGLTNPNGTWSLYIRQQGTGTGLVAGGWGIEFQVPTAASAAISGRVMTADGRPIRNAVVTISGNSLPEQRVFQTGTFGYYMFDGLQTGETYVVTVNSRRFTFQVPARVISLVDNVTDADFIADAIAEPEQ